MKHYRHCEKCFSKVADHRHHLFSNTKINRLLYGKYLDYPKNIMYLCSDCHLNKAVPKMTELEFCEKLGIKPRSKNLKFKNRGIK